VKICEKLVRGQGKEEEEECRAVRQGEAGNSRTVGRKRRNQNQFRASEIRKNNARDRENRVK
jgi:hypothetical protein